METLNKDLLHLVLKNLSTDDLLNCTLVSKSWRKKICEANAVWQTVSNGGCGSFLEFVEFVGGTACFDLARTKISLIKPMQQSSKANIVVRNHREVLAVTEHTKSGQSSFLLRILGVTLGQDGLSDAPWRKTIGCKCHEYSYLLSFNDASSWSESEYPALYEQWLKCSPYILIVMDASRPVNKSYYQCFVSKVKMIKDVSDEWIASHVILVRTKCDDPAGLKFRHEFLKLVAIMRLFYIEVSAETGSNIDIFLDQFAHIILANEHPELKPSKSNEKKKCGVM